MKIGRKARQLDVSTELKECMERRFVAVVVAVVVVVVEKFPTELNVRGSRGLSASWNGPRGTAN